MLLEFTGVISLRVVLGTLQKILLGIPQGVPPVASVRVPPKIPSEPPELLL